MPTAAVVGTRTRPYLSSTRRSGGEAASTSATGSASASSSNVMTEADRACIFTGLRPATAIQIDRDDDPQTPSSTFKRSFEQAISPIGSPIGRQGSSLDISTPSAATPSASGGSSSSMRATTASSSNASGLSLRPSHSITASPSSSTRRRAPWKRRRSGAHQQLESDETDRRSTQGPSSTASSGPPRPPPQSPPAFNFSRAFDESISNVNLDNFGSSILANAMRYMDHTNPNHSHDLTSEERGAATAGPTTFPPAQGGLDTRWEPASEADIGVDRRTFQSSQSRAESIVSSVDYNYYRECAALGLCEDGTNADEPHNQQQQHHQQQQPEQQEQQGAQQQSDGSRLFRFRPFDDLVTTSSSARDVLEGEDEARDGESEINIGESAAGEEVRLPRSTTRYLQEYWDLSSHDSRLSSNNVNSRRSHPRLPSVDTRLSRASPSSRPSSSFSLRQRNNANNINSNSNNSASEVIDLTLSPPPEDALLRTQAWTSRGLRSDDDSASLEDAVGLIRFDWESSRDEQPEHLPARLPDLGVPRPQSSLSMSSRYSDTSISASASALAVDWSLNRISEREEERLRSVRQDSPSLENLVVDNSDNSTVAAEMLPSAREHRQMAPRSTISSVRRWERSIQRIRDHAQTPNMSAFADRDINDDSSWPNLRATADQLDSLVAESRRLRWENVETLGHLRSTSRRSSSAHRMSSASSPLDSEQHSSPLARSSQDHSLTLAGETPSSSAFNGSTDAFSFTRPSHFLTPRPSLRLRTSRSSIQDRHAPNLSSGNGMPEQSPTTEQTSISTRRSLLSHRHIRPGPEPRLDDAAVTGTNRLHVPERGDTIRQRNARRPAEDWLMDIDDQIEDMALRRRRLFHGETSSEGEHSNALTAWRASDRAAASVEEQRRIMTTYRAMEFPDPESTVPGNPGRHPLRPLLAGGRGNDERIEAAQLRGTNSGTDDDVPQLPSLRSRSPLSFSFAEADGHHRQQPHDHQQRGPGSYHRRLQALLASSDASSSAVTTSSQRNPILRPFVLSSYLSGGSGSSDAASGGASVTRRTPAPPFSTYTRQSDLEEAEDERGVRSSEHRRGPGERTDEGNSNNDDNLIVEMENVRRRILAVTDVVNGLEGLVGALPPPPSSLHATSSARPASSAAPPVAGESTHLDNERRARGVPHFWNSDRLDDDTPGALSSQLSRLQRIRERREREERRSRAVSMVSNESQPASSSVSATATAGAEADGAIEDGPPRLHFNRPRDVFSDIFLRATGSSRYGSAADSIVDDPANYLTDEQFAMRNSYEHLMRLSMQLGEARPKGAPADVVAKFPTCTYRVWQGGSCADPLVLGVKGEGEKVCSEALSSSTTFPSDTSPAISADRKGKRRAVDPLDAVATDDLPLQTVARLAERETRCAVCLETYDGMDMLMSLPCDHSFHEICIKSWLQGARTCPCCRRDVCEPESTCNRGEMRLSGGTGRDRPNEVYL